VKDTSEQPGEFLGYGELFYSCQFVSIRGLFSVLGALLRLLVCLANRATKGHVVSVRVEHDKIPHAVWLVGRLNFYDGSVLLYLLAIIVERLLSRRDSVY
jgi:hypothetical protein